MAADDDTTTAPAPATASPDLLAQLGPLLKQLMPQPVQQDTTPVSRSGISLLGEALAGGAPVAGMSDADKETAGTRALMNFSTGLMAASRYQPGQTIFSNLAQGFQGAQRGEIGAEEMAMAKLGAQQEYAQQQGQNKLEAIKTALPFLRMAQGAGMPNLLAGGGAPPAPNVAQGGSISGNTYEGAIAGHEGTTPNPNSSAAGVGQFLAPTWQAFAAANPDLFKGMSPEQVLAARSDPVLGAKAITWLATQNAPVLAKNGAPVNGTSLGIAHYLGAGPAAAVMGAPDNAPVSSLVSPDAVKANPELAKMTVGQLKARYGNVPDPGFLAATRGQPGAPPVVGGAAAPAVAATPPAAPAAPPAGTIQGTPDTGGAQVAGPGALPGRVVPPGPAVPGDVNAIIGGMKGGGANAATLAPGAATAGPAAPTIAQAGPPTVTPPAQPAPQVSAQGDQPTAAPGKPTFEQFQAQHPITIDPATYTVPVSSGAMADAQAAKQTAAQNLQSARMAGDVNAANKAQSDFTIASQNVNKLQQDAAAKSLELRQAAEAKARADQITLFNTQSERDQAVTEKEKDRQAAVALATQQGQQAIQLEQAKGRTADESKVMQSLDETRESARTAIDQVGIARALSQSAGDPTFWQTVQKSHPDLVQAMANSGFLSPETVTQLGAAGASDAAMQKLISMARTGSGFQRMTNLDVQILTSQAPQSVDPQAWREAKMDYLQSYMTRQMRYVDAVRSLRADGTPLYQAQTQAEKDMGDVVPTIPNFNDTPQKTAVQQRIDWAQDHLAPNTFFRAPDGKLVIYRGQQGQTAPQTTAPAQPKSLVPVN